VFTDFVANDFGDVQPWQWQVSNDLLEHDVGGIVRANEKVSAAIKDMQYTFGQELPDRRMIVFLPTRKAQRHWYRAHDNVRIHVWAKLRRSFMARG
jgi:hypothetical protein